MHNGNSGNARVRYSAGFTYIGLLIFVAVMAVVATAALGAGAAMQQRDAEAELLAIGLEMKNALQSYADASPPGHPTAPRELAELLRDPRYPGVRRHLRRIYPDPFLGLETWGIVRAPDGRIVGIHSLSQGTVLKRAGFPTGCENFEKAERHAEWVFALMPIDSSKAARPFGK